MRIFILGAGYIGQAVLESWSGKEDFLWASTTTESKLPALQQVANQGFLLKASEENKLREILEDCDALIVCVAPPTHSQYKETYLDTAQHVRRVLDQCKKPVYVLYTSSTSVYGNHNGANVDEKAKRLNLTENGKILCQTEDIYLGCSNPNITVCILRLAGIYGPGRELEKRAQMMAGRIMGGNPHSPTNHIHRDDIAAAIEFCVKHQCQGIYNLACDDHPTRSQLYESLCQKLEIPPPKWDSSQPTEHGSNIRVSNKKIRKAGFVFTKGLITG